MRTSMIVVISGLLALTACGGGAGKESPRAVADAVAGYMSKADMQGIVALMPSGETLKGSVDCSKSERDMVEQLEKAKHKYLERGAKELAEEMKGVTVSIKEFDLDGSQTKTVAAGEEFEGCVVTKEIALHKSKMTLALTKDGQTDDDGETWRFIQLDGKWYFAKM
ncbi:MAG: hypothetical protein EP329_06300 [Deltaproteobacteria bacterium]|nr:MAG: hypothetical protein EP329_06300 [Deltaproteobacteria bacterium]